MNPTVIAVHVSAGHTFSKTPQDVIRLLAGQGVEGDAHCAPTVKHRARVARDPSQPNLRQVHLIHAELFDELARDGFDIAPGDIGENVTTTGIDLLALPAGARLRLGPDGVVEVTGLRNPCYQLNDFRTGLMPATLAKTEEGELIRKAGVMAIVVADGEVRAGDPIEAVLSARPHQPLQPV